MTATQIDDIRSKLLGGWRLISWEEIDDDGTISYPLGKDAAGQLMYTCDNRVSAQLVRVDQARFVSDDWRQASVDEMGAAWSSYFGYFGTFSIDLDQHAVIHHIEGSWFPNLVGSAQVRHFDFQDQLLVLNADTPWGKVRIVWEKLASVC